MYSHPHLQIHIHTCIRAYACMHMHACICTYICVYVYACMHMHVYIRMYACMHGEYMYVSICMYTYILPSASTSENQYTHTRMHACYVENEYTNAWEMCVHMYLCVCIHTNCHPHLQITARPYKSCKKN